MIWADRLALAWAVIVYGLLALAGAFGDYPDVHPGHNAVQALYFVLPVWAVLRLIDFITGGPARRRGQFRVSVQR
jgi:hypothetical protein